MPITHYACPINIVISRRRAQGISSLNHIKTWFAKDYILSLKCLILILSGSKECSRKLMVVATWQHFCGDTSNTFGREDQNFQWSRAYSYYPSPSSQREVIWTSEIVHACCVPEVFECKEFVSWCAEKYIPSQTPGPFSRHSFAPSIL
jgi:hypothetical protein